MMSNERMHEKSKSGVKGDDFSFRYAGYKIPIVDTRSESKLGIF